MIALLCPSRKRPELLKRMVNSIGGSQVKVYVAISLEDVPNYSADYKKMIVPDNMPTAHKWNLLAEWAMNDSSNKLFMLAADDMIFDTPGWDRALIEHYNALGNKIHVYALQDSRDENGTPHPIVTREYIEAMGYFMPPIFTHWFIDSWTVQIARYNNCFTHLKDYLLVHDKPSDRGQGDETHNKIREYGWHERDKWVDEHCRSTLLVNEMQRLRGIMCA